MADRYTARHRAERRATQLPLRAALALTRDAGRLVDDRVLQLLHLHPLHDLAVLEEEPDAVVAVGDPDVGRGGLARPVHLAAHHGDVHLALELREALLDAL